MATSEPVLLDLKESARLLSTTHWTIRGLIWDGQLPFLKVGRKLMVDRKDLLAWVERSKMCNKN